MNVLVYSGPGTSKDWLARCRSALHGFLGPSYDVMAVGPRQIAQDPWPESAALLVFPGGRDLPYCADLNGAPNERIRRYVEEGGRYLGICAGAYYACSRVEFEIGTPLEVVGDRELAFYSAAAYGAVWPGFVYDSEAGARNAAVSLDQRLWRERAGWTDVPKEALSYWNGGGSFRPVEDPNVEIVGRYAELPDAPAAGVLCKVGQGRALLWGVHPEHDLLPGAEDSGERSLLRASLALLGLKLVPQPEPVPAIQPQLLTASSSALRDETMKRLLAVCKEEGELVDALDRFRISMKAVDLAENERGIFADSNLHASTSSTFSPNQFYAALPSDAKLGRVMLYSPVVTSTQTLLDKNPRLLDALPEGLVSIALRQVSGRGRGANAWVSPAGCLCFSMIVKAPPHLGGSIVFAQYLFALAIIDAVKQLSGGEDVGVRLKWPNDIYVDRGTGVGEGKERYKKLGGILVNSSYAGGAFTLVIGCGLNTFNSEPTIALADVLSGTARDRLSLETVLASVVSSFDKLWTEFMATGGTFKPFLQRYTSAWLHSGQEITIAATGQQVRIVGITTDYGLLRTEPVDGSGGLVDLQPDGNSFDMLRGLITVKPSS